MIGEQGGFGLVSLLRGLLGIITILGIAYAMSYDRKRIDWKLVGGGSYSPWRFYMCRSSESYWKDVARYLLS